MGKGGGNSWPVHVFSVHPEVYGENPRLAKPGWLNIHQGMGRDNVQALPPTYRDRPHPWLMGLHSHHHG